MNKTDRLARAKKYLAVAESKDAKHEAYKAAASEIIAHKNETGDNLTEIAVKLGRVVGADDRRARQAGSTYVGKLIKWYEGGARGLPFERVAGETERKTITEAKKALRDPVQRKALVESLTPEERHELVDDTLNVAMKPLREEQKTRKAVREEHMEDPRSATRAKAKLAAANALLSLRAFASLVRNENWTKKEQTTLLAVLDKVDDALETARLATTDAESIDWDSELARLNSEAESMEGGV
jgi:hypothetical protein